MYAADLALSQAALNEKSIQVESLRSQLAEATATANSQAAELRVLRRQRQLDAEQLKVCEKARRELHERQQAQALQLAEASRLRIAAEIDARNVHSGRKSHERRQSKQSRADKVGPFEPACGHCISAAHALHAPPDGRLIARARAGKCREGA